MSVSFILGRAGSGKSRFCIDAVRAELVSEPRSGPKLILLVPEQASLQTERELLCQPELSGAERGEVLSFRRFAQRVLQSNPPQATHVLSPVGRAMVLQKLSGELESELQFFRTDRHLPGLYQQLSLQIKEFIVAAIRPDDLAPGGDSQTGSESLRAKLADLRLLYSAYLDFLQQGYVDPVMNLDLAGNTLSATPWLADARVWVDGFAGFSQQEIAFLVELASHCRLMTLSLLVDPQADGVCNDKPPDPYSLFWPTVQTYHKLLEAFGHRRLTIEPPTFLPQRSPRQPEARTQRNADLEQLEAHAFTADRPQKQTLPNVIVFEAGDPTVESAFVIQQIIKLTSQREKPLRYRDISIIARQLTEQHTPIVDALQRHNIPYFVDRRPPLCEHPLYHFLRALLDVARENFSADSVRQLLKSDLFGLEFADADLLENYIVAHRIAGLGTWHDADWKRDPSFRSVFDQPGEHRDLGDVLKRLNHTRRLVLERLSPWISSDDTTRRPRRSGRQWAQLLYQTVQHLGAPERIEEWALAAERDGTTAEAAHHRQAWRGIVELFDDFVGALGTSEMPLVDFANSIVAGLSQLDTGLVPPAVDQIVVGSIERSRQPETRAAFVLGMNDGTYPLSQGEQFLLTDDDRRRLIDAGLNVDPPRAARLGDERLLAYIALTRPTEQLFISYCQSDADGRKLEPSPYLKDLKCTFPSLQTHTAQHDDLASQLSRITSSHELVTVLATRLRQGENASLWNTIYDRARHREDLRALLRSALQSLVDTNESGLSPQLVDATFSQSLRTSITALEQFASCPFKYFASVQLRLRPRPTGEMDALQLGSLYHAVLDDFTRQLISDKIQLPKLTEEQMEQRLVDCIHKFNRSFGEELAGDPAAQPFLWERLHQELLAALCAHRAIQSAGQTTTIASELAFGLGTEGSLPELEISTPKGRRVLLRGKIDRVDTADWHSGTIGFVFDYKRSRQRTLKLSEVYHGLSLQLIVYLLALEELGKKFTGQSITPGGAFYLPLIPDYTIVDHPDEKPDQPLKPFRPRGIFRQDALKLLDCRETSSDSSVIAVRINRDGSFSKQTGSDHAAADDFERLMHHVNFVVGSLCDGILDGRIPVRPYRLAKEMPCPQCDYRSVCRFEFPESTFRPLDSLDKQEVWSRLENNA